MECETAGKKGKLWMQGQSPGSKVQGTPAGKQPSPVSVAGAATPGAGPFGRKGELVC